MCQPIFIFGLTFQKQCNRLKSLFDLEPALKQCYQLREDLYQIFELNDISKEQAKEKIDQWCKDAQKYETKGFNPFISFIETYRKYEDNILNYFTHRISSGPVEGLNNKIKVIKRRGFGFRNIANFAKRLFWISIISIDCSPHIEYNPITFLVLFIYPYIQNS